jgi:hypothetical protein
MKKFVWIGPIVNKIFLETVAVSVAANAWQLTFIDSLLEEISDVEIITYKPERAWPRGCFFVKSNLIKDNVVVHNINYLNLYLIREFWISLKIFFTIINIRNQNNSKVINYRNFFIFFYNCELRHSLTAFLTYFFRIKNIVTIAVVADYIAKKYFKVYLYLSHHYFLNSKFKNSIHFDGGVEDVNYKISSKPINNTNEVGRKNYLMYAGSITEHGGILNFVRTYYSVLENCDVDLYISGSGLLTQDLIKEIQNKPRIKFLGFLNSFDLNNYCFNSIGLINPRPILGQNSENNFPSKIHFYCNFNKPIITTHCLGLSPIYDNFLYYFSDDLSLEMAIVKINEWSYSKKYTNFSNFKKSNTWSMKIKKLIPELYFFI